MTRAWVLVGALSALLLSPAVVAVEDGYVGAWFTVDCGGSTVAGGDYTLRSTAGQPDAGSASDGGDYAVIGGFWTSSTVALPAGAIANGGTVPGAPLRLAKTPSGNLTLSWTASCLAHDVDYAIHEGPISFDGDCSVPEVECTRGFLYTHARMPGLCSTGGATTAPVAPGGGDRYYLVVPLGDVREGSYGTDSDGLERPPGTVACLPQLVGACP